MRNTIMAIALAVCALGLPAGAMADARRDAILAEFLAQAKTADPAFDGFSADRGAAFFRASPGGGKPDTPSCTTCHGERPEAGGQTRAGKAIDPMAVSVNPDRYTDPKEVAKWFLRNCKSVLGRECSAAEKGDFITFMEGR